MLIVNNLGDSQTTGYFWKHADWPALAQRTAWRAWWGSIFQTQTWQARRQQLIGDAQHARDQYADIDNTLKAVRQIPMNSGLPPGDIYLLGDCTEGSIDSRSFGAVPTSAILGAVTPLRPGTGPVVVRK